MKVILITILLLVSCSTVKISETSKSTTSGSIVENEKQPEITFFDVGNGTCSILLCDENSALLYDCGHKKSRRSAAQLVNSALKYIGDRELKVIISHADSDHTNLIQGIYHKKKFEIIAWGGGKDDYNINLPNSYNLSQVMEGLNRFCSPIEFEIIDFPSGHGSTNQSSIILHMKYKGDSIILSGDAEGKTEHNAIRQLTLGRRVSVLTASHHGALSRSSNSVEWMNFLKPESFIVSAGDIKNYGHPRCEVVKRAERFVVKSDNVHVNSCWESRERYVNEKYKRNIFNTFDLGDITYNLETRQISIQKNTTEFEEAQANNHLRSGYLIQSPNESKNMSSSSGKYIEGNDCRRKNCSQIKTCEEAYFLLEKCNQRSLDRNGDGVPCEKLCN